MNSNGCTAEINYPAIVFKVKEGYYAINSKNVATIMKMPEYEILPEAPHSVTGIFRFRSGVIPIISVRILFGMPTLREESSGFSQMLEERKQDHIKWVRELKRCVQDGDKFVMAKDPHKCAFGRWFDNYKSDNHSIQFHLNKIAEPHRLLHETAHLIEEQVKESDEEKRRQKVKISLSRAQEFYMPKVLELLDDAKELFNSATRSMLIVIEQGDYTFALAVDEVLSVEELTKVTDQENTEKLQGSQYLSEIRKSSKLSRLILMIDDLKVADIAKTYRLKEQRTAL